MSRQIADAAVVGCEEVASGIHVLTLRHAGIARAAAPGQFVNIRTVDERWGPLLRRPFSISRVQDDCFEILYNVVGAGTKIMSGRKKGETLNVLGPLGRPYHFEPGMTGAILVGGGLGVAPFPFLTESLQRHGIPVRTYLGARTGSQLALRYLADVRTATDDGSEGFHGTVVDLLRSDLSSAPMPGATVYGCGPTRMMQALAAASQELGLSCELSLEGEMACGIGLCQGCPVEHRSGPRKYALVCTDGPTFDGKDVIFT